MYSGADERDEAEYRSLVHRVRFVKHIRNGSRTYRRYLLQLLLGDQFLVSCT